uniref:Uncharacterized protein n=1 Tax=Arundo donax TaxID=35708 RepID=A0A0A9FLF6_ARUDO
MVINSDNASEVLLLFVPSLQLNCSLL